MNNLLVSVILVIVCVGSVSGLTCYYCQNCPVPFNPYDPRVTDVQSYNGFCVKQSTSSAPGAPASRGAGNPGLCNYSGCGWSSALNVYACCCRSSYCNTGSVTSKSTISVLFGALTLLIVKQFF